MVLGRLTILDDACMRSQPAPALRDTYGCAVPGEYPLSLPSLSFPTMSLTSPHPFLPYSESGLD